MSDILTKLLESNQFRSDIVSHFGMYDAPSCDIVDMSTYYWHLDDDESSLYYDLKRPQHINWDELDLSFEHWEECGGSWIGKENLVAFLIEFSDGDKVVGIFDYSKEIEGEF